MPDVLVTLPDGSSRVVPAGRTLAELATELSPRLAGEALAGKVGGRMVDLSFPLEHDVSVELVTSRHPEALPDPADHLGAGDEVPAALDVGHVALGEADQLAHLLLRHPGQRPVPAEQLCPVLTYSRGA